MTNWTDAELDLHNAITSAVEGATGSASLAMRIADTVVPGALDPTPELLYHLALRLDAEELQHVGFHLHAAGPVGAAYALSKIAHALDTADD